MPVTKQAIKKVRQDTRKTLFNLVKKTAYKKAVKAARTKATPASISDAFLALDRAAKTNVIHRRKASRLKSRLSRLIKSSKPKSSMVASA